jgi:phage FluMu gp28-like protein
VFAGKGGDVFLDEVDLHKDSGKLIDMAMPCIMWGNQLEAVSAYKVNGTKDTPWAKMIAAAKGDNPQGASLHRVTIDDAIAEGIVEKIVEKTGKAQTRQEFRAKMRALCRTQAAWESQFLCIVQDAGGKLIPVPQIVLCEMPPADLAQMVSRYPSAPRFGGYDVARRVHASAWHEYAQIGTGLYLADRQTWHDVTFEAQEAWISSRMTDESRPRVSRMAMDATGLGMQMAERMAKKFPGRVDQVNLESHRRTELCVMLADRFARQRVFVPADDQLRADLSGPVRGASANGSLRIIVPAFVLWLPPAPGIWESAASHTAAAQSTARWAAGPAAPATPPE